MLTLYFKPTCPFSRRVLAVVDRLDLEVEMKDVSVDEEAMAELVAQGGKTRTPYLVDSEKNFAHYESDDIVAHLQSNYGTPAATPLKPRLHISDSACVSCEG